ncbi:GMC oxidoreductase [Melanomma pulvis-pyrius CBS 109.77]|uniref:GMC oxidoreductase n=1 Tax=Melanomma pulvis-pyrius CBS 109.77 TaxID=1314802 RepID=A0A6A6WUH3_9PLEO|nr:GMC oxidoreductase [Melanomma pulvis-pyrius CBS 109.77]
MTAESSVFDYIIVGGGTAGVVIASRLSTYLPTSRVLLLEAGPDATSHPSVTNPIAFPGLSSAEFQGNSWTVDHSTVPQEHCNNRRIFNPAGRLLSGSSAINVGIWMRASRTDYSLIAEKAGHERFTFEKLLPYFKRLETHWDKDAELRYHGFEGPIHTLGGRKYPLRETIQRSAEVLGHHYNPDAMKGDPTGLADMTQCFRAASESSSERQHSSRVYELSGVHVMCDTPVARILVDTSKRTTGVELVDGRKLYASREVVLSCGTQKTPQILMLSGIGPKDELSKHNIPIIIDSPAVGQNLFDHSALTLYFALKNPKQGLGLPFEGTMKPEYGQGMPWEFNIFANIPASTLEPKLAHDGLISASRDKEELHPHLRPQRCHFLNFPFYFPILATPSYNPSINPLTGTHIAITSLHLLPLSRGGISLHSASADDAPIIDPRYLSTTTDRYIMRTAVQEALALISTPPLSNHILCETPPIPSPLNNNTIFPALTATSSDDEVDARIRAYVQTIAHPMGTCALGTVLDAEFRVKGVDGLRVCDASVFPEPLGAMPSLTIFALGEVVADLIAGREGRESKL